MKAQDAWQDVAGQRWAKLQARTDVQLGPLGRAALSLVRPQPGERVLDVGCGGGTTTFELADLVGATGSVVGVDIARPMIDNARERASGSRHPNVEFVLANAATERFAQPFDLVFSRFGVMFFEDAVAAFTNLHAALRPGGRLGFVCWQALERNPWAEVAFSAVRTARPHQPWPTMTGPGVPGPFYFAEPRFVESVLERAGFGGTRIVPHEEDGLLGGSRTLAEAAEYCVQIGPAARFIAEAEPEAHPALEAVVSRALAPYAGENGVLMPMRTWLVTAERG